VRSAILDDPVDPIHGNAWRLALEIDLANSHDLEVIVLAPG
jgi:hypothetical protein